METNMIPMVRNFRNASGWESVALTDEDVAEIQNRLAEFNKGVLRESMRDAADLLANYAGLYEGRTDHICSLAMFLASKRIVNIHAIYDEFLRAKIQALRNVNGSGAPFEEVD